MLQTGEGAQTQTRNRSTQLVTPKRQMRQFGEGAQSWNRSGKLVPIEGHTRQTGQST